MPSYRQTLERLEATGNLRRIPAPGGLNDTLDFSTNDYMGLAAMPTLQQEFFASEANRLAPMSASASRLLASCQDDFYSLEAMLSGLYGRAVLLFNSGYHANTGAVSALASDGTMIIADRLVHASIIDGIVLSRAPFARFPHNDYERLEALLTANAPKHERVLVIVESVYSMDGDRCDLDRLLEFKSRYPNVILYVDEAHAFGALGSKGLGLVHDHPCHAEVDVIVGTLGKAAASSGAFVAASAEIHDYLLNRARSFIFSTALPPITCRWSEYMISKLVGMDAERDHLQALGERLREVLQPFSSTTVEASHIIPLIVGDASRTVELSRRLLELGVKVLPIRTPTVPAGTERLRFSISASMTFSDIDRVAHALDTLRNQL